jgi:hypothetical protein
MGAIPLFFAPGKTEPERIEKRGRSALFIVGP